MRNKTPSMAFDRASMRRYDGDGRLHVAMSNISKATVNPYQGKEIPDYLRLGLDPDKVYYLLRDPKELEKAAPTFNNLPILSEHVPCDAMAHDSDEIKALVVGSTGTDAVFEAPYLKNSTAIWPQSDIAGIESDKKKQFSSAYRYRADMKPGVYEGLRFDGVMRDIVGNHVALVEEGRAGPDVVVADRMPHMLKSRRAVMLHGALAATIAPKLAMDKALPDLSGILKGVTAKNLDGRKSKIASAVIAAVTPNLAQDEGLDVEDVIKVIGAVQGQPVAADEDDIPDAEEKKPDDEHPAEDEGGEGAKVAELLNYLKGILSEEEYAKVASMVQAEEAMDEDPEGVPDVKPVSKEGPKGPAMDMNTVAKMIREAEARGASRGAAMAQDAAMALRSAEEDVRPIIGKLANPPKDAKAIYGMALDSVGVPADVYEGMTVKGLKALVEREIGRKRSALRPIAQDAASGDQAAKLFPNASKPLRV